MTAERLYLDALKVSPRNAEALHLLGLVYHQMGYHERATRKISRAIELSPKRAHYHNNLGEVLRTLGHAERAEKSYRAALALDPHYADAIGNLGIILLETGREQGAEDCFRQALALEPRYAEAAMNLGNLLRESGRLEEACEAYRQAVSTQPAFAEAQLNLGNLLLACGRGDTALPHLEQAMRLRPDISETHLGMAGYRIEQRQYHEAERHVRDALALEPANVTALAMLGHVLFMKGQYGQAQDVLKSAVEIDGTNPQVLHALGNIEAAYGNRSKATEYFQRTIELAPHMVNAYESLVGAKRFKPSDRAMVEVLDSLAKNDQLSPRDRGSLHFALGKVHDDLGEFDTAFRHYQTGNLMRSGPNRYDREAHARLVGRTMDVFSRRWLARHARFGSDSSTPIFLFGMPRSGTTLVEQIISSHPKVFGGGELDNPPGVTLTTAGVLADSFLDRMATDSTSGALVQTVASEYSLMLHRLAPEADRITDKDPFKFFYLGLLAAAFPRARMIHCRRDPMDVGLSIYFQNFDSSNVYAFDLYDIGHYQAQHERLMDHWRGLLTDTIFEVDYERLIHEQERVSRSLLEYCGLEWDARCLEFYSNPRGVSTASKWQVRQPLYSGSVQRWKRYESHLGELRRGLESAERDTSRR